MDHDDVRERLELAALEPGGLDRLMAGDTPEAAAVATHLAGCEGCADEFGRLSRAAPLLRDVISTTPPADLRERTLAYVQAHGRPRGATAPGASLTAATAGTVAEVPLSAVPTPARPVGTAQRWVRTALPWAATLAAAVLLSVAINTAANRGAEERLVAQAQAIEGLSEVTSATLAITGQPDVERVSLTAASGSDPTGSLLFSPSTARLVVVADGLARPPAGSEFRCWMEVGGTRSSVGRMFFAGDPAYWVGDTPEVTGAGAGTRFGVSLVEIGGTSLDADPVMAGEL